jgi:hypothetical protein
MSFALGTMLLICVAATVRSWRRIFQRNRPRPAPRPGTAWVTHTLQVAAFAVLADLVDLISISVHASDPTSFYQFGHLEGWLRVEVLLSVIALIALVLGVVSAVNAQRRTLRAITRIKFAIATAVCIYFCCFILHFHLIASPTRY